MKNRQLEVLVYLLQKKKTTYKELADNFEVSSKTIERDIDRLAASGVPVYCQPGSGGGVYIDEKYKFSTSYFAPEEIAHMVAALHIAKSFTSNPRNKAVLQKLCLIAPNITTMFESNVSEYFNIDIYDEPTNFKDPIFDSINKCLDFKLYATINGVSNIVCLGYVYKPEGIYLYAYQEEYRLVKIKDIENFECSEEIYDEKHLTYQEYKEEKKNNESNRS